MSELGGDYSGILCHCSEGQALPSLYWVPPTEGVLPSTVENTMISSEVYASECLQINRNNRCIYGFLELRGSYTSRSFHQYLLLGFLLPTSKPLQMPFSISGSPAYFPTSSHAPFFLSNFAFSLISLHPINLHHSL